MSSIFDSKQNSQTNEDFEIKDGVLVKYHETSPDAVIPDGVTSIRMYAFSVCKSLTSVTIPNSVTSIDRGAFIGCTSLKSITIPDNVTSIGDGAFAYCKSLTSITIPDGVTSIGFGVFYYCESLESIYVKGDIEKVKAVMSVDNPYYVKLLKPIP